jgi:hypothetical protein
MHRLSFLIVPVWPWGQLNFKRVENSLFSERYGQTPSVVVFGVRITWRRWRRVNQ